MSLFYKRLETLIGDHQKLIADPNTPLPGGNGIYERYRNPVLTAAHAPLYWRYDLNHDRNPNLLERQGINATFNPGAIYFNGKHLLVVRVEGVDRKSFFAIAESETGIDGFKFWPEPILLEQPEDVDVNVYDMRLTQHEDGWIYGLFCTERKDPDAEPGDTSSAVAGCGIVRTKDLKKWERLADLVTPSPQQRNVVLHPEYLQGKYAFYTRPQDGFIQTGKGGGIGWGLADNMENAVIVDEKVMEEKVYHTIKEVKNGAGAPPIKTSKGWIHIAHGVRNTAAGLRYVIYGFMTSLKDPSQVIKLPGGHLIAPEGMERIGDVSNVVFTNGLITKDNGDVYIYYASSDTRCHVATTSVERLLDYMENTPADPLLSHKCVERRLQLIRDNLAIIKESNDPLMKKMLER